MFFAEAAYDSDMVHGHDMYDTFSVARLPFVWHAMLLKNRSDLLFPALVRYRQAERLGGDSFLDRRERDIRITIYDSIERLGKTPSYIRRERFFFGDQPNSEEPRERIGARTGVYIGHTRQYYSDTLPARIEASIRRA